MFLVQELLQLRQKATAERWKEFQDVVAKLFLSGTALVACCIGLLPALIWGHAHQWANFQYMLQLGKLDPVLAFNPLIPKQHIALVAALIHLYQAYVAPHIIGGALPLESAALTPVFTALFAIGLFVIVGTVLLVLLSLRWHHPVLQCIQKLAALPLLFGFWTAIIFCTSPASAFGLQSFQVDYAGRYATPLMLALPFFYATLITCASMLLLQWRKRLRSRSSYVHNERLPHQPMILQGLLFAFVLLYLLVTVYTYTQASPAYTFQSPSCPIAPANDEAIISYLEQQHVHYAWALTWIGNPITFKTQENIIIADPRYIAYNYTNAGRIYSYINDLLHAQRPAFLAFVPHDEVHPLLLRYLDALHVTYQTRLFVAEPGTDIQVVTALSRTVPIEHTAVFQMIFPDCLP